MQQQEPVSTLLYRVKAVEDDITELKKQLDQYQRTSENNLKLQSITDTVKRIEDELKAIKEKIENTQVRVLLWIIGIGATIIVGVLIDFITRFFPH